MPRFPAQRGSQRPDFHPLPLFSSDRFHLPLLMSPYRSPSLFTCLLFGWLSRPTHDPRFKVPLADHLADGANARAHTRVSSPLLLSSSPVCSASIAHCTIAPRGHWPLSARYRHACSLVSRRHTARSRKAPCCESALFSAPLSSAIYREAMLVPRIDSARHARLRHARNEDGSPCREPIFPKCMFIRSVGIVAFARIPKR